MCVPSPATLTSNSGVPLLAIYICAVAFVVALALTGYLHSAWREVARVVTMVIAAFAVWRFISFPGIADERRARLEANPSFGFRLHPCPSRCSFWWIREGIWHTPCFLVGCFGVATRLLLNMSMIVFSWRYQ